MKKIILVFVLIVFTGCETTNSEISASSAGEWLMAESSNKGKKFVIGDDKNVDIVMKFMKAYENMDAQTMVDIAADTVKFHPGDIAGVFDVDMTNTDFINERQSNWDSINRSYNYILPTKLEDSNWGIVDAGFREDRFIKDGTVESDYFFERFIINNDGEIVRVVQWSRPVDIVN